MLTMLRTALGLLNPRMRVQAAGLILLGFVTAIFEALGIGMIFPIFQVIGSPETIADNRWIRGIYTWLGRPDYTDFLTMLFVSLFLYYVVKNVIVLLGVYLRNRYIWHNNAIMANRLLQCYLHKPYAFHLQVNSASLLRNMTDTVSQFFMGTVTPIILLVAEAFIVVFVAAVLILADPMAFAIVGLTLGIPLTIILRAMRHPMKTWGARGHDLSGKKLKVLNDALNAIQVIKVFGREADFLDQHRRQAFEYASITEKNGTYQEAPRVLLEVLAVGALLIAGFVVLSRGQSTANVLPVLGVFAAAALRLMPSFNRISSQINAIRFNAAALKQISDDLGRDWSEDRTDADISLVQFKHELTVEDLRHRYVGGATDALKSVNLKIKHGESIAFVGRSGSGKSTLANLLLGLLHPSDGRIVVDGEDVTARDANWRLHAGYIPQDVFLMDATLRQNIAFRLDDSLIDETRLAETLATAQINEFLDGLPDGLDTFIGERGVRLSGGQRQRVAIARALYDNPDVLVMDEATSALDAETESAVTKAIDRLHGDKTLFIIAHRLSTVKNCDRIFWLAGGRVVDSGSFDELRRRNAEFQSMIQRMNLTDAVEGA